MTKPIIGINTDFRSATHSQPSFSYVAAGYYDAIANAGGIPILLPPVLDEEGMRQILDEVDGCVLIGGSDLDPRNDGFMLHPANKIMDPRRENFDRRFAHEIVERRVPVLGIGAGMQLLNVVCGGNLYLHIPIDLPGSLPHRDSQIRATGIRSISSPRSAGFMVKERFASRVVTIYPADQ